MLGPFSVAQLSLFSSVLVLVVVKKCRAAVALTRSLFAWERVTRHDTDIWDGRH